MRVLAPGSSLTAVISLSPPTLPCLAAHVGEWLHTHYGPGVLFDCQLAAGDVCLFVFFPSQVSNVFAGAVQFVRGHPFFRLLSRGTLRHTPAERLRFLTFHADEADTLNVPLDACASSSSSSPREEDAATLAEASGRPHRPEGDDDAARADESGEADTGPTFLQLTASVSRPQVPPPSGCVDTRASVAPSPGLALSRLRAVPSPQRCRHRSDLSPSVRVGRDLEDVSCPPSLPAVSSLTAPPDALSSGCRLKKDAACHSPMHSGDESCPPSLIARFPGLPLRSGLNGIGCDLAEESCPLPPAVTGPCLGLQDQPGAVKALGGLTHLSNSGTARNVHPDLPKAPARAATSSRPVLTISNHLPASSEVRSLSALLHAVAVWGGDAWLPFACLRVPWHIRRLLPPCSTSFCGLAPTALHIFTDGSADSSAAGWGTVLVAEYGGPDKRGIVAFAGGRVIDSPAPPSFSARTNNAAEAWAVLVSQLAALALPPYLPLTFWIDSRVTLEGATGKSSPALIQGDPALSNAVRASAQVLQQRQAPTQWCWTPGHARVGCNELADHIAGRAAQGAFC